MKKVMEFFANFAFAMILITFVFLLQIFRGHRPAIIDELRNPMFLLTVCGVAAVSALVWTAIPKGK